MTDITLSLSALLKQYDVSIGSRRWSVTSTVDEFLKEAYRVNAHVASLHAYLRSIRQSYLSTSLPRKRLQGSRNSSSSHQPEDADRQYFTDAQRDEIDAETKKLLQELNVAVQNLADAEQIRQKTESTVAQRRHGRKGLGALGRWAAGGAGSVKSPEETLEEARMNTIKIHRESVLWFLRRKLEDCGEAQRAMMETRLMREVEKSKSALYKTQGMKAPAPSFPGVDGDIVGERSGGSGVQTTKHHGGQAAHMDERERHQIESQLSPEQLQLFAEENQDMLKHYEDSLDQVRTAERSLLEISELQTSLATNLATQSAHIDQLVADSYFTTENVGGGNKQLKRASERRSTAKFVFYGSCSFCLFLVVYDLII